MGVERPTRTPRQVAVVIAVFFLAYGAYARWFTADEHPLYALASWGLGIAWLVLALLARDGTRS